MSKLTVYFGSIQNKYANNVIMEIIMYQCYHSDLVCQIVYSQNYSENLEPVSFPWKKIFTLSSNL